MSSIPIIIAPIAVASELRGLELGADPEPADRHPDPQHEAPDEHDHDQQRRALGREQEPPLGAAASAEAEAARAALERLPEEVEADAEHDRRRHQVDRALGGQQEEAERRAPPPRATPASTVDVRPVAGEVLADRQLEPGQRAERDAGAIIVMPRCSPTKKPDDQQHEREQDTSSTSGNAPTEPAGARAGRAARGAGGVGLGARPPRARARSPGGGW